MAAQRCGEPARRRLQQGRGLVQHGWRTLRSLAVLQNEAEPGDAQRYFVVRAAAQAALQSLQQSAHQAGLQARRLDEALQHALLARLFALQHGSNVALAYGARGGHAQLVEHAHVAPLQAPRVQSALHGRRAHLRTHTRVGPGADVREGGP